MKSVLQIDGARIESALQCVLAYSVSSIIVLLGVELGFILIPLCTLNPLAHEPASLSEACSVWDGVWYDRIVSEGYSYRPSRQSAVAFFPVYPTIAASLSCLLQCDSATSLIIVSNAFFFATLLLLGPYCNGEHQTSCDETWLTQIVCLVPTGFFFRMAYTESAFMFFVVATLLGIKRGWSPWFVALIAGAASGTRLFGILLMAPVLFYAFRIASSRYYACISSVGIGALCSWGIFMFITFQWLAFGEPLAFIKTQKHWAVQPSADPWGKAVDVVTFVPVATSLFPDSGDPPWARLPPSSACEFNLFFWNPIVFLVSLILLICGASTGKLSQYEFFTGMLLILVPYVCQSWRAGMTSMARYSLVSFPCYLVFARATSSLPSAVRATLIAPAGLALGVFAALHTRWYWFF